jgi:HAD superfamily hydrolase (TIGR01549 family)
MADTAVFDVDGTLVDSNYQHTVAWHRDFRRCGLTFPLWRVHRHIGMGGDKFVPAIAGEAVEQRVGDDLRAAWAEEFDKVIDEIEPLDGAIDLLVEVRRRGFRVVLASSGTQRHVEHFIGLLDGRSLADAWTTSDDVEGSKPDPDLVDVAMRKVNGTGAVMLGDSVWDVEAASKVGVPTVGLLTGGYSRAELEIAGAACVFDGLVELLDELDETPFGRAGEQPQ